MIHDETPYDAKNIYLKKDGQIIGLHAIGIAGPYEYILHGLDGSVTRMQSDFNAIEQWGNEYDADYNMLGRGSFRVFQSIDSLAQELEADGWIRFERD